LFTTIRSFVHSFSFVFRDAKGPRDGACIGRLSLRARRQGAPVDADQRHLDRIVVVVEEEVEEEVSIDALPI
jgi:hypothetical protein